MKAKLFSLITLLSGILSPLAYGDDSTCVSKLRSCFTLAESQRDLCFYNTAKLAECRTSHDGELASKRAAYSALVTPDASENGIETPPEPVIFDRECVENFDTLWLSHLVNEDHNQETCQRLTQALNDCLRDDGFDLGRP
jgi:hypothetical protein